MKKRILLIFGISLLLLTGCVNINLDEDKKEPEIVENETNHQEDVEDQTEDEDKASTEKEGKYDPVFLMVNNSVKYGSDNS